jgi:hypothetical protein
MAVLQDCMGSHFGLDKNSVLVVATVACLKIAQGYSPGLQAYGRLQGALSCREGGGA